jgi:hypothetical protein
MPSPLGFAIENLVTALLRTHKRSMHRCRYLLRRSRVPLAVPRRHRERVAGEGCEGGGEEVMAAWAEAVVEAGSFGGFLGCGGWCLRRLSSTATSYTSGGELECEF